MKKVALSACLFLLFQLFGFFVTEVGFSTEQQNSIDNSCYAVVTVGDHTASFTFPHVTDTNWTWYRNTTNDNSLEYAWTISLGDGNSPICNFGAYLFKFPGSTPRNGTLRTLIMKTQHSIFDCSGKIKDDLQLNAKAEDGAVTISIDDRETFNVFFHSRPSYVRFYIKLPDKEPISCDANIDYY
jgi:hypothetical protein